MAVDPTELDQILEVLREHGVTSFSCPAFSVALGPEPVAEPDNSEIGRAVAARQEREAAQKAAYGNYGHRSLWPGGEPPRFHAASKEKVSPFLDPTETGGE